MSFAGSDCLLQLLCTSLPQLRFSSRATAFGLFWGIDLQLWGFIYLQYSFKNGLWEFFCRTGLQNPALGQYSWRNPSGNIFAEQHWGKLWPAFRISFKAARGITNWIFGSFFGTQIRWTLEGGGQYMWGVGKAWRETLTTKFFQIKELVSAFGISLRRQACSWSVHLKESLVTSFGGTFSE